MPQHRGQRGVSRTAGCLNAAPCRSFHGAWAHQARAKQAEAAHSERHLVRVHWTETDCLTRTTRAVDLLDHPQTLPRFPRMPIPSRSDLAKHWDVLDRNTCFLNHGSYGACPRFVREVRLHSCVDHGSSTAAS